SCYYYKDTSDVNNPYMYGQKTVDTTTPVINEVNAWQSTDFWGTTTYYEEYCETQKQETVYTNSIKADRPVAIDFLGYTQGQVTVNSTGSGNVVLDGPILNPTGTTTITSGGSIVQENPSAYVSGSRVVLSAAAGIGSSTQAVCTDASSSLYAETSSGNIYDDQIIGSLPIDQVIAGTAPNPGDVSLTAQGAITVASGYTGRVQGGQITLTAGDGGIGAGGSPIMLQSEGTAASDYLTADANGD